MKRSEVFVGALLCLALILPFGRPAVAQGQVGQNPVSLNELKNARYSGIGRGNESLTLRNGTWQGPPTLPSAASRPWVEFLGDLVARGDLDGDNREEAVVMLASTTGGTGVFHHLAVVRREGASLRNLATRFVGDRIQVIGLRIEDQRILLELVRSGPNDPACCPAEVVTLQFRLVQGRLTPPIEVTPVRPLSPELLAGAAWRLIAWNRNEPAASGVSLRYEQGQFKGVAACNAYGASVQALPAGGSLKVSPPFSTRKACDEPAMVTEHRFLSLLPRVTAFGFDAGRLALQYREGDTTGVMLLERGPSD